MKYEIIKQLIYIDKYGDVNAISTEDIIFQHTQKKFAKALLSKVNGEKLARQYDKCKRKTYYTKYAIVRNLADKSETIAIKLIEN